jgi:hypothetical protein
LFEASAGLIRRSPPAAGPAAWPGRGRPLRAAGEQHMSRIALVDDDRNILTSVSMTLEA